MLKLDYCTYSSNKFTYRCLAPAPKMGKFEVYSKLLGVH